MADDAEIQDVGAEIKRVAGTLEYGGRKVLIVACVLDTAGGEMITHPYVTPCGHHQAFALLAGANNQLAGIAHHAAENMP